MPHTPQPVPPIFEPEVAARAILYASHHRRREMFVGGSTTLAVLAAKLFPGRADRYLARTGYLSQQTNELVDYDRQDNLWSSPPGDYGARGAFSEQARTSSRELWFALNRNWLFEAAAAGLLASTLLGARRRTRHS